MEQLMTRVALSINVQFLRIPTRWSIKPEPESGIVSKSDWGVLRDLNTYQRVGVPEVAQGSDVEPVPVDGWELRDRFFRLKFDKPNEPSVLRFLNDVGVWEAIEDLNASEDLDRKDLLWGAFGSRLFRGWAIPVLLTDLKKEQEFWRQLLADREALKAYFGTPLGPDASPEVRIRLVAQSDHFNKLPLRLEWRGGKPLGVIETITGREMLIATIHLDLLRGAKFQVCKRPDCSIPFSVDSRHQRKYCEWYCGHIESVRRARRQAKKQHSIKKGGN
jgi:hypothetical protein